MNGNDRQPDGDVLYSRQSGRSARPLDEDSIRAYLFSRRRSIAQELSELDSLLGSDEGSEVDRLRAEVRELRGQLRRRNKVR